MFRMHSGSVIEKEPADKRFFQLNKNIENILSFLKIILIFLSSVSILYLKINKQVYINFLYVSDNLKSLDIKIESTNVIEILLVLGVLHTALGRGNCYFFTFLMEIFM